MLQDSVDVGCPPPLSSQLHETSDLNVKCTPVPANGHKFLHVAEVNHQGGACFRVGLQIYRAEIVQAWRHCLSSILVLLWKSLLPSFLPVRKTFTMMAGSPSSSIALSMAV